MKLIHSLICFGLIIVSVTAEAASFDCKKASTAVEKMICADSVLSKLDEDLAKVHKAALAAATDPAKYKSEGQDWLKNVRNICKDKACLTTAYQGRIDALTKPIATAPSTTTTTTNTQPASNNGATKPVQLPHLKNYANSDIQKQVNQAIDKAAKDLACDPDSANEGMDNYFEAQSKVAYNQNDIFSIAASASYFCGGPYPTNDSNISMTFDLKTGQQVELGQLFKDYEKEHERIARIIFNQLIAKIKSGEIAANGDCANEGTIYSLDNFTSSEFNFYFSDKGLVLQPSWPHVIEACAEHITVPYAQFKSLAAEGGLLQRAQ